MAPRPQAGKGRLPVAKVLAALLCVLVLVYLAFVRSMYNTWHAPPAAGPADAHPNLKRDPLALDPFSKEAIRQAQRFRSQGHVKEVVDTSAPTTLHAGAGGDGGSRHRVLVMGLPFSGVESVARLISRAGGEPEAQQTAAAAAAGTLRSACQELMGEPATQPPAETAGAARPASRRAPAWANYGWSAEDAMGTPKAAAFRDAARAVVAERDRALAARADGPQALWVVGDHRLALTGPHWADTITGDAAVCVLVVRQPAYFAEAMQAHAAEGRLSAQEWSSVWEQHMRAALRGCVGHPLLLVSHEWLLRDFSGTARALLADLARAGAPLPTPTALADEQWLAAEELRLFGGNPTYGADVEDDSGVNASMLSMEVLPAAAQLHDMMRSGAHRATIEAWVPDHPAPWLPLPEHRDEAYATIVTGDAPGYIEGAMVLAARACPICVPGGGVSRGGRGPGTGG